LTPIASAFIKYVTEHKESIKEKYFFWWMSSSGMDKRSFGLFGVMIVI
jgi:hypothetical protein